MLDCGSSTLGAVMVTVDPVRPAGAVYKPVVEIVPTVALPPGAPFTFHTTLGLVVPVMVDLNCTVSVGRRFAPAGEMRTRMPDAPTFTIRLEEAIDPGSGLDTLTCTDIPFCADVAVPVAVNWVDETNFVVSAMPLNMTLAPFTNLLPVTVSVKFPTETAVGDTAVTVGTGFSSVTMTLPERVLSDEDVASMLTEFGLGRAAGAW